jgi:hypothetical protein
VPGDQPTIQAGIDAAQNGDTVLVDEGTYIENINFSGKAITVASNFIMDGDTIHINNTIIDGSQPVNPDNGSVIVFSSGEDSTSILCGFTITGGTGTIVIPNSARVGGGVLCNLSGATICHNQITNNVVNYYYTSGGGGIASGPPGSDAMIIVENNWIESNFTMGANITASSSYGAGLALNSHCRVTGNIILDNVASAELGQAWGGGLGTIATNYILVNNNIVKGNKALTSSTMELGVGGGIYFLRDSTAYLMVMNNIISNNEVRSEYKTRGAGIGFDRAGNYGGDVLFANNIVYGNYSTGSGDSRGGGIYLWKSMVKVFNNTITKNSSDFGGGLYSNESETSVVMNSIFWGDTSNSEVHIGGIAPEIVYSDIQGGWGGTGNINSDPLFDGGSDFYFLTDSSPCIDAGNPDAQYNDVEDPNNPGNPMPPARGTLINDMGHCGGPISVWGNRPWPLPVELTSFTASTGFGKVILNWTTATEINNLGFEIERKIINDTEREWVRIGFSEGHGTTTENKEYSYVDDISRITATSLVYRLKQIDFDGSYEYSDEVMVDNPSPIDFALHQNYPNPFNPTTRITFGIPLKSQVSLKIFNSIGEQVAQLVNEEKEVGSYEVEFNAANLPSGIYFYRLQVYHANGGAGSFISIKKMVLLK